MAVTTATAIVVRVSTEAIRPASSLRVDGPAEHHGPEGVGDVPERLGETARDRVDAGLPDAEDRVDEECIRTELEPLGERAGQGPHAEPELLGQERHRRPEPETPVPGGDPQDQPGRRHQGHDVQEQGQVQAEPRDRRGRDDEEQQEPASGDADQAVGHDALATQERVQADREEELPGQRQRGVRELRSGQVRDEDGQRSIRPGRRRQAVQPAGQDDREPADDRGPQDRVGHPAAGGRAIASSDDRRAPGPSRTRRSARPAASRGARA